jgi:hypothetical protein
MQFIHSTLHNELVIVSLNKPQRYKYAHIYKAVIPLGLGTIILYDFPIVPRVLYVQHISVTRPLTAGSEYQYTTLSLYKF